MLIGDASYSIYLSHFYLIWQINGWAYRQGLSGRIGLDGQKTVVLIAVVTAGVVVWALIERPLLRWSGRHGVRVDLPAPPVAAQVPDEIRKATV